MKMSFMFKIEGFEFSNTNKTEFGNNATNCTLENFEYNIGFETKPGEMQEYMQELAKVLPGMIDGVMGALKIKTETIPAEEVKKEDSQQVQATTENNDPDKYKEV